MNLYVDLCYVLEYDSGDDYGSPTILATSNFSILLDKIIKISLEDKDKDDYYVRIYENGKLKKVVSVIKCYHNEEKQLKTKNLLSITPRDYEQLVKEKLMELKLLNLK